MTEQEEKVKNLYLSEEFYTTEEIIYMTGFAKAFINKTIQRNNLSRAFTSKHGRSRSVILKEKKGVVLKQNPIAYIHLTDKKPPKNWHYCDIRGLNFESKKLQSSRVLRGMYWDREFSDRLDMMEL